MRLILIFIFLSWNIFCQEDTLRIEVSGSKYTQLIFPSDILDKDPGNIAYQIAKPTGNYVNKRIIKIFYAGEKKDYTFESNLQIETSDGYIYDLPIINVTNPKKTTYLITESQAITNIRGSYTPSNSTKSVEKNKIVPAKRTYNHYSDKSDQPNKTENSANLHDDLYVANKEDYIRAISEELTKTKSQYSRFKSVSTSQNIKLSLKGIYANKDELYFVFNLKNYGGQPFDLKKWSIYKSSLQLAKQLKTGNSVGKEIVQPLPYEPEYVYNFSKRVNPNSEMNFTLVLSKFTIAKNKAVYFDIDELNGERDIYLPIFYKKINYPINYNK